jgi:hypothetical protein
VIIQFRENSKRERGWRSSFFNWCARGARRIQRERGLAYAAVAVMVAH